MSEGNRKPTLQKLLILVSVLALIGLSTSCQKLEPPGGPRLSIESPSSADAIPAEYGELIAAVPHEDGRWVSFWFEKTDKTIVGVWVQTNSGKVGKVITIPRS